MMDANLIDRIKDATNLVELIGSRVRLKKSGKNYTGLCPFHDEKTPSFTVSPTKQFYHCFGCGAQGDAIEWLMQTEGLPFMDAVRKLAQSAGIAIPDKQQQSPSFEPLYAANAAASCFYHQRLESGSGTEALRYLLRRGISHRTIETFELGASHDALPIVDQQTQLQAGLLSSRENGNVRPFFIRRLMFPIRDRRGRVLAFGARTLQEHTKPKYLNTTQTPIFDKSTVLYGLYEAQQHIRKTSHAVVVEGYMDVIMLHQYGLQNAVAGCGTSVTEQHLRTLLGMADRITFAFDADKAGKLAARRVIDTLLPLIKDQHTIEFAFVPEGHDPDSFVRTYGAEAMLDRIAQGKPLSSVIEAWFRPGTKSTLERRAQLSTQASLLLGRMQAAPNLRNLLAQRVSELLGLAIYPQLTQKGRNEQRPHRPATKFEQREDRREAVTPGGTPAPSTLMQTHVINPVVRTLLAHPQTKAVLPPALADQPVIAAALAAIDASGDIERSIDNCRHDKAVLTTLQAVSRSAAGRRDLQCTPDVIQHDAGEIFKAAAEKLQRILAVEFDPATTQGIPA